MLKQTTQESWKYRVAAFNQRLHQNEICPANHNVFYRSGWYYLDGEPKQRPGITQRSKELEENENVAVFYNRKMGAYVLSSVNRRHDPAVPVRGEVRV
jgi:hypothetical protein